MILNIHSDASYLSEPKARSRLGGTFFMGTSPKDGVPIQLNGSILALANICKFVVASTAEAELGTLFYNCQDGTILRLMLEDWGIHSQQHQCIVTIARPFQLQMILSKNKDQEQWKRTSFGQLIKLNWEILMSHGIQGKKILLTTSQSILTPGITKW
jgi:hypothetical protein